MGWLKMCFSSREHIELIVKSVRVLTVQPTQQHAENKTTQTDNERFKKSILFNVMGHLLMCNKFTPLLPGHCTFALIPCGDINLLSSRLPA